MHIHCYRSILNRVSAGFLLSDPFLWFQQVQIFLPSLSAFMFPLKFREKKKTLMLITSIKVSIEKIF